MSRRRASMAAVSATMDLTNCVLLSLKTLVVLIRPPSRRRDQAQEYRNQEVETQRHESGAQAEQGVPMAQHQKNSHGDPGNHAGKDCGRRDAPPVEAQNHAREELSHTGVSG